MRIWCLKVSYDGRAGFGVGGKTPRERLEMYNFYGKGYVEEWILKDISFDSGSKRDNSKPLKNVSFFWRGTGTFICDEYTKEKISSRFNDIQFLPVKPIEKEIAEKTNYYLVNILRNIDGLNVEKCEFEKTLGIIISKIKKYSFKKESLQYPIFNVVIENKIFNEIYVTDEFKNYVEEVNIEGFEFIEVFDFENKGE